MRTLPRAKDEGAELHVASLVVRATAAALETAAAAVAAIEGAEVHAAEDGKLVVTIEAPSERAVADRMDAIAALPGVVSALLVYHHAERLDALQEVIR